MEPFVALTNRETETGVWTWEGLAVEDQKVLEAVMKHSFHC